MAVGDVVGKLNVGLAPVVPVLPVAPGTLHVHEVIGALVAVAETATVPAGDSPPTVAVTTGGGGGGGTASVIVIVVDESSTPSALATSKMIVYVPLAVTVNVGAAAVLLERVAAPGGPPVTLQV